MMGEKKIQAEIQLSKNKKKYGSLSNNMNADKSFETRTSEIY